MSDTNAYGLGRSIPEAVKLEVRRRCGFGCVICSNPYVVYHHFCPSFSEAREHKADGITLLCCAHHDEVTRGLRDEASVRRFNLSPRAVQGQRARFGWAAGSSMAFRMGNTFLACKTILMYGEQEVIGYEPPEQAEAPWRLNATLLDSNGLALLRISGNEMTVGIDKYDVKAQGNELRIREKPRHVVLHMVMEIDNVVWIRKAKMEFPEVTVSCTESTLTVQNRAGACVVFSPESARSIQGDIGIRILPSQRLVLLGANSAGGAAIAMSLV